MKKRKILLLLFMISGFFSYLSLSLFHLLFLITQGHNAHHISYIAIPWMLGTSILAVIPLIGSKKWILQHRHLFLFSCAIWPLLDGLMFLKKYDYLPRYSLVYGLSCPWLFHHHVPTWYPCIASICSTKGKRNSIDFLPLHWYQRYLGISVTDTCTLLVL